ncbi:MAG TPA: formate dehydrogenase subunit gamma [Thermoanaerobaculia bacterium]
MSTAVTHRPMDAAVIAARNREDIVVGNEIIRHNRASRLIHWSVAVTFFLCLFTGMPIWTPVFGWMAYLFGGLSVCRVIHPYIGIAFFIFSIAMFFQWISDMHFRDDERGWLGPKLMTYMRYETDDSQTGKYNGGQKLLFWAVSLGALGLLLSGLVMWFPRAFPPILIEFSFLLHDVTFILFVVAIVFHIYLGTAAEPGTFGSMTRGTVTRTWARLHHGRWYREVTGDDSRRA